MPSTDRSPQQQYDTPTSAKDPLNTEAKRVANSVAQIEPIDDPPPKAALIYVSGSLAHDRR